MSHWRVHVGGDATALKLVAECPQSKRFRLVEEGTDYWLDMNDFRAPATPEDVRAYATDVVKEFEAAIELYLGLHTALQTGHAEEIQPDGARTTHVLLEPASLCMVALPGSVVLEGSDGTREATHAFRDGMRAIEIARSDSNVAEVLRWLSTKPPSSFSLYKVYEVIRDDCFGAVKQCAAFDEVRRTLKCDGSQFTGSLNHPAVLGRQARHARTKGDVPKKSMTFHEAVDWAERLVRAWIDAKSA